MQPITGKRSVIPEQFTVRLQPTAGPHSCRDFTSIHWHTVALGPTATQLLWRLARTPTGQALSINTLAEEFAVQPSAIAKHIDRLARRRYLDIDHGTSQMTVRSHVPLVDAVYRQQRSTEWNRRYQAWRNHNNT